MKKGRNIIRSFFCILAMLMVMLTAVVPVNVSAETKETEKDSNAEADTEQEYFPYEEIGEKVIKGREDWMFINETMPDYIGDNPASEEELQNQAAILTYLDQICASVGMQMYCIIPPNKNTIYSEYMPSVERTGNSRVQAVEEYMHENTSLKYEFICDELMDAKKDHLVFYIRDTHWNAYGALEGADVFRSMAGLTPIDRSLLKETTAEAGPTIGDLLDLSQTREKYGPETEYFLNYKPEVMKTRQTVAEEPFVYNEYYSPDAEIDQTLVLVGDSYREQLIDYLSLDYKHSIFINQLFMTPDHAEAIKQADVLILEEVERYQFNFDNIAGKLISYLTQ